MSQDVGNSIPKIITINLTLKATERKKTNSPYGKALLYTFGLFGLIGLAYISFNKGMHKYVTILDPIKIIVNHNEITRQALSEMSSEVSF